MSTSGAYEQPARGSFSPPLFFAVFSFFCIDKKAKIRIISTANTAANTAHRSKVHKSASRKAQPEREMHNAPAPAGYCGSGENGRFSSAEERLLFKARVAGSNPAIGLTVSFSSGTTLSAGLRWDRSGAPGRTTGQRARAAASFTSGTRDKREKKRRRGQTPHLPAL